MKIYIQLEILRLDEDSEYTSVSGVFLNEDNAKESTNSLNKSNKNDHPFSRFEYEEYETLDEYTEV